MPTRTFRTVRTGRVVIGAAIAVLLLGACVNNDVDGSDLADALEEAGASQDQAECAADRFDEELDQDERNEVAGADSQEDIEELPESVRTTYEAIMAECVGDGAPAEESSTTETTAAGDDTTTTAAE